MDRYRRATTRRDEINFEPFECAIVIPKQNDSLFIISSVALNKTALLLHLSQMRFSPHAASKCNDLKKYKK